MNVVACVYVFVAIAAGWGMCWWCIPREHHGLIIRSALTWFAITAVTFLATDPAIFFGATSLVLLALAPRESTARLSYFCAVLPAAPAGIMWDIPFPGINYLYIMSYAELVSLLVLAPIAVSNRQSRPDARTASIFSFATLYLGLCIILDLRETSITNGLRLALEHLLTFGLLVVALKRCHTDPQMARSVPTGLLIAGIILGFVGLLQAYTRWTLYDVASGDLMGVVRAHVALMRDGGFRVPGTQDPIPFGIMMTASIGLCYWSYHTTGRRLPLAHLALAAVLVCAMLASDSRGALIGAMAMILVLVLYSKSLGQGRKILFTVLLGASSVGFFFMGLGEYLLSFDEYDTFTYRLDLMTVSAEAIAQQPLFGAPSFHPIMEQMRNDSGIIDIVNAYLQVALRYGLIGALLFALPAVLATRVLIASRAEAERDGRPQHELERRAILALAVAFMLAIGTVSLVGILPQYFWMLIGIAAACSEPVNASQSEPMARRAKHVTRGNPSTSRTPGVGRSHLAEKPEPKVGRT